MKKNNEYLVEWCINVDAENIQDAAQKAFSFMQDPDTTANVFTVSKQNTKKPMKWTVDLLTNETYRDVR